MNGSGIASKKEAEQNVQAMRAKAMRAAEMVEKARHESPTVEGLSPGYDAAMQHYQRCVSELEEAINAASIWHTEPKEEDA